MVGCAGLSRVRESSERPKEEKEEWDGEPW
jgi:hypothetical protein